MRILGLSLALLNLLLWFSVPAIRAFIDDWTGRWANPANPRIMNGVQELFVYFDPWLARGVFPLVYIVGFALIPFLLKPSAGTDARPCWIDVLIVVLLVGFECVWLLLIGVAVFLRGPNWNLFWPGEPFDEDKFVLLNAMNLSDHVWLRMGRPMDNMWWPWREMPGFVLLGGYLIVGMILAHVALRLTRRATPACRCTLLVLLLQIAALVPLKMLCRWVFNVKYLIFAPEFGWNV